jgi:hypothetical protein
MIKLTPEYIKESGGLIPSVTRRSAEIVRKIIGNAQFSAPPNIQHLTRIITHKNPHLDEYMAILIFRAILPPEKRLIPLEEMALSSTDNDQVAKAMWPKAAVFGMGGIHTGGAKALVTYDEHTKSGQKKKNGSATMLILHKLFSSKPPTPLLRLCEEIDHVDAFGGAHFKHIGNYIKDLHDVSILLKKANVRQPSIAESLSPQWKEAIINSCIAALLIAIVEKYDQKNKDYIFTRKGYWEVFLRDSLEIYQKKTLLYGSPYFSESFNEVKKRIFAYNWKSDDAYLTERQPDGTRKLKNNEPIQQLSLMPFIAALCQEYWGPILGQIILSHFWEVRIMRQITFFCVKNTLENNLKDLSRNYPFINSEIGSISLFLCNDVYDPEGELKTPLIIEINAHPNLVNVKAALDDFLNRSNQGFGYTLLHQQRTGTIVLTKGKSTSYEEWVNLCDLLIEIEGNSDEKPAGCWHRTENMEGKLESFLLNGNAAHQYVPKSSINGESLKALINRLHE